MKAKYKGASVASAEALSRTLGINVHALLTLAGSASDCYFDFQVDKKDGSKRDISGPRKDLKIVQKRINRKFFECVDYPCYLYGGLKGRDYVQNAKVHNDAKVILSLDVENFFPKISRSQVVNLFQNFMRMPPEVAGLLADLCTRADAVPQGACTSTYISNLVFYEYEPRLVRALSDQGLTYTRLIDDITVSSLSEIGKPRISKVIDRISAMLKTGGYSLKQKKTRVTSRSNPEKLMEVTGLFLNRGKPRVKPDERAAIRKEFRKCVFESKIDRCAKEYHDLHERVSGRVAKLLQLDHFEAAFCRKQLRDILPLYDILEIRRTRGMVAGILKTPKPIRSTVEYIERYHQVIYRINIIARSNNIYAARLRAKMNGCRPEVGKDEAIYGRATV